MTSTREKLANKKTKLARPREKFEEHPANLNNFQEGSFYNIEISLINPNPYQPRKYFNTDSLEELCQSIKQKGVLQPIIIRRDQNGSIYLVAGERRLRAAKMAGLEKIPAILTKGNPVEISLIENLQRDNLKPIEEAEALNWMREKYNYTQEKLALVIGKARTTITETLSLNNLTETIKKECRHADIYPRRLLVEIAKQKTAEAMNDLFNQIKKSNLKSEQVRDITRKQSKITQRTPAAIVLNKTINLISLIEKLNLDSIEENEKFQLISGLEQLKKRINDLLG
jgi:ParB family transcriptional regulator, chromosome partitioning protein